MKRIGAVVVLLSVCMLLTAGCAGRKGGEKTPDGIEEDAYMAGDIKTPLGDWLEAHGMEYRLIDKKAVTGKLTELYAKELEKGKSEGYTPVVVSDDGTGDSSLLFMLREYDVDSLLTEELPDGKEYLDELIKLYTDPGETGLDVFDLDGMSEDLGVDATLNTLFTYALEEDGGYLYLVKAPTDKPWEVVLYLPFGGWNSCPEPAAMAAVCKYWFEKHSAYPALIAGDEMNFYLPSPIPESEVGAAAKEYFAFCEDSIFQGLGSFKALEDMLAGSTVWYFWWD